MIEHLPFPTVCIVQATTLFFLPFLVIPSYYLIGWPMLLVALVIILFIWLCDFVVLILSFTIWWNVPLVICAEGIKRKDGDILVWSDVTLISAKKGFPTYYGRTNGLLKIRYSNGVIIHFETHKRLIDSIRKYCQNELFLKKFNESIKKMY